MKLIHSLTYKNKNRNLSSNGMETLTGIQVSSLRHMISTGSDNISFVVHVIPHNGNNDSESAMEECAELLFKNADGNDNIECRRIEHKYDDVTVIGVALSGQPINDCSMEKVMSAIDAYVTGLENPITNHAYSGGIKPCCGNCITVF